MKKCMTNFILHGEIARWTVSLHGGYSCREFSKWGYNLHVHVKACLAQTPRNPVGEGSKAANKPKSCIPIHGRL